MSTNFAHDVGLAGPVFLDYGLAALDAAPESGTEVHARRAGISPGGLATLAIAGARLGLRTALAAPFGGDALSEWCWEVLASHEGVNLSASRRIAELTMPVTFAVAHNGDRSMITYAPGIEAALRVIDGAPPARSVIADLSVLQRGDVAWWRNAAAAGSRLYVDVGWDPLEQWRLEDLAPLEVCHAFTPNEREAMAYTRTDDAVSAARSLAERVPLVVVTRGSEGVVAIDAASGAEVSVPALPVEAQDSTGAGDVFAAALVRAATFDVPIADQVAFAVLASGIAVSRLGSALSAPGWADIDRWWKIARRGTDFELRARYGFLDDIVPPGPHPEFSAAPTSLPLRCRSCTRDVAADAADMSTALPVQTKGIQ